MINLSVNINKIASLRNARGVNNPNLIKMAEDIQSYGAQGITVHPRPDERHIKYDDVRNLKSVVKKEFNIEGSQFIPLAELEERISEIDQTSPIFLICKSGNRSAKAAEILKTKGMTEITNVIGGMDDWKNKIDVG